MESAEAGFDWGMFWQAASAIATTFAVAVALWQTKYQNLKKVKITFNESVIYALGHSLGLATNYQYVSLDVVNTGNRKIIISRCGIKLSNDYLWLIFPDQTPIGMVNLPIELDVEQSVSLPWKKENFIKVLRELNEYPQDKKVSFFVQDITGAYYMCKSTKTIQQYLDEANQSASKHE